MSKANHANTMPAAPTQRVLPIPRLENPSLLFQAFQARRAELRDVEGIAACLLDPELARVAQVVAERAHTRVWSAIDRLLERTPTRDEDIVELAIVLADRCESGEYPADVTRGLLAAIFALYGATRGANHVG